MPAGGAIWKKRGRAILPANDAAEDEWRSMQDGGSFMASFKSLSARSLEQMRLYWGLMGILVEHEIFPDRDSASDVLKIASGHCDIRIDPHTGQVWMTPKSIAFAKLGQPEFNQILDRMIDIIVRRYLAGTDAEALRAEVFAAIDGPEKRPLGRRVA